MSKYIIDVGDAYIRHGLERTLTIPVRINEHEDHWMDTRIPVTPYTEPDLEQVRKEAYEDGYKTAKVQCNIQAEKDLREVGERHYQKGLSDAWEAARKLVLDSNHGGLTNYDIEEIFGVDEEQAIINYSASEAVEKIRQYEQKQEESEKYSIKYDQILQGLLSVAKACNAIAAELSEVLAKMKEES